MRLENISKVFNKGTADAFFALNGINYQINQGDFITIVGGNGAGKSTMLNAIAGNFPLDSGRIYLRDQDITKTDEVDRAAYVARVFQDAKQGTAPRMTVAENLALAERRGESRRLRLALSDDQRGRYQDMLKSLNLGLENRLDAEIGLLSGGQRQAIALLMATMKKPEILLLDEHTAALDPKTSRKILEITAERVAEDRLTAIMITHNLQDALTYGNRMLHLHRGQVVKDYTAEEKAQLTAGQLYEIMEAIQEN